MYKVVNISSGIVAVRFHTRSHALDWLVCNNYNEAGDCLNLYQIVKD